MNKANLLIGLALAVCAASAMGETDNKKSAAEENDLQRQRLNTLREEKMTELAAQDAVCLSRFAVTDCQNQVGKRRREMLADLKRQEAQLNEADRRQKGADQLLRSQDKAPDRALRQSEVQANQLTESQEDRLRAQNEKVLKHKRQAKTVAPSASVNKLPSGLDAASIESNRAAFSEKQRAAEQRRMDREKRLRDKAGSSAPLPRASQ
jgi:hypothetical protein